MSFVCGQGVRVVKKRSDEDVVGMCLAMLSRLFPEQVLYSSQQDPKIKWMGYENERIFLVAPLIDLNVFLMSKFTFNTRNFNEGSIFLTL